MTRITRGGRALLTLLALFGVLAPLAAILAFLALSPRPAESAFPGVNGKIVFASDREGGLPVPTKLFLMNADGTDQTRLTNNDATGTWIYPGAVTGPYITATVTDFDGNTSEFSGPVRVPPVGGIADLPEVSDSSARNYAALAGLAAAALVALTAGAWYARRRWLG